mmetsp:Transcript_60111/g.188753  ORF Transcript_60111/g.188753 Transcript_60111/m.188753 type:complete len:116 (-) Transcript_60111:85-432(-)
MEATPGKKVKFSADYGALDEVVFVPVGSDDLYVPEPECATAGKERTAGAWAGDEGQPAEAEEGDDEAELTDWDLRFEKRAEKRIIRRGVRLCKGNVSEVDLTMKGSTLLRRRRSF